MKKISIGLAASAVVLAACEQSPDAALNATCISVMSDPEVRDEIFKAWLSVDAYCECATTILLALPEAGRTKAIDSFELIDSHMADHDGDAEAAFESIRDAARADGATPEIVVAYQNLDALGDQLDNILDGIQEGDGTCPA